MEYGPASTYEAYETWKINTTMEFIENGEALLKLYAQDPNALSAYDPEIVGAMQVKASQETNPVLAKIGSGATNWCVASAPVDGWTQAVLPNGTVEEFWDVIFRMTRADGENPVQDWKDHLKNLQKRRGYLQDKNYDTLKYSSPGTDLTVGLPERHLWHSGQLASQQGINFTANIPTEEVFTMPHKKRVNGTVSATRPLPYGGNLIEDFSLTFKDGKVVNASAKKGEVLLQQLLATDDGSSYLGEVALVPHSSPISHSGLLFYNILYDENASCHLALGNAYRFSMEGATEMSEEEWVAAGGNTSAAHLDFMIGSGELDIDGMTADGRSEPIMRSGEWAFDV
jgi:aminopeptidase